MGCHIVTYKHTQFGTILTMSLTEDDLSVMAIDGEATCADSGPPCESSHLEWAPSIWKDDESRYLDITYAIQTHKKSCHRQLFLYVSEFD